MKGKGPHGPLLAPKGALHPIHPPTYNLLCYIRVLHDVLMCYHVIYFHIFFVGVISDLKIGELSSHILCPPITPNVSDNDFSNLIQIDFN